MTDSGGTESTMEEAALLPTQELRRVYASSLVGSAIEYYDFILYASAAGLVFNRVFFAGAGTNLALVLSFGTLAAGYVARPVGGLLFGRLGDRLGRRRMLITTVVLMGAVSVAIGLLPPTSVIGPIAPVLLVVLRVVQGLAVGGEFGGATLLAFEQAPSDRRGFASVFAYLGGPVGTIIATLVLASTALLPEAGFLSWGWRVPFVLSAVLVVIAVSMRLKISESSAFTRLAQRRELARHPVRDVLAHRPRILLTAVAGGIVNQAAQGMMGAWAIAYVVTQGGLGTSTVLGLKAIAGCTTILVSIWAARLTDRVGRRPVLLAGAIGSVVLAFPIIGLIDAGTAWALLIALVLGLSVIQGTTGAPYGAFAAELYPTAIRYTGVSITSQLSATLGAGFTPLLATGLLVASGGRLWVVAAAWIGLSLISVVALYRAPITSASPWPRPRSGPGPTPRAPRPGSRG